MLKWCAIEVTPHTMMPDLMLRVSTTLVGLVLYPWCHYIYRSTHWEMTLGVVMSLNTGSVILGTQPSGVFNFTTFECLHVSTGSKTGLLEHLHAPHDRQLHDRITWWYASSPCDPCQFHQMLVILLMRLQGMVYPLWLSHTVLTDYWRFWQLPNNTAPLLTLLFMPFNVHSTMPTHCKPDYLYTLSFSACVEHHEQSWVMCLLSVSVSVGLWKSHLQDILMWVVVKQNPNTVKSSSAWSLLTKLGLIFCRNVGGCWYSYKYTAAPASGGQRKEWCAVCESIYQTLNRFPKSFLRITSVSINSFD